MPTHQFSYSLHQDFQLITSLWPFAHISALGNTLSTAFHISVLIYFSLDKSVHCVSLMGLPVFSCALQSGQCTHGGQRTGSGARQSCSLNKVLPCSSTFGAAHRTEGAAFWASQESGDFLTDFDEYMSFFEFFFLLCIRTLGVGCDSTQCFLFLSSRLKFTSRKVHKQSFGTVENKR